MGRSPCTSLPVGLVPRPRLQGPAALHNHQGRTPAPDVLHHVSMCATPREPVGEYAPRTKTCPCTYSVALFYTEPQVRKANMVQLQDFMHLAAKSITTLCTQAEPYNTTFVLGRSVNEQRSCCSQNAARKVCQQWPSTDPAMSGAVEMVHSPSCRGIQSQESASMTCAPSTAQQFTRVFTSAKTPEAMGPPSFFTATAF